MSDERAMRAEIESLRTRLDVAERRFGNDALDALLASHDAARARVRECEEALRVVAAGSPRFRAGGAYVCGYCGSSADEGLADLHPKECPRSIARRAMSTNGNHAEDGT